MATPDELCGKGLSRVSGVLSGHEVPVRAIYLTERAAQWMRQELPGMQTDGFTDGALTPREQTLDLFRRFILGDTFENEYAPKVLKPHDRGVTELRTPDLRFFGWFHRQREFIVASAARKADLAEGKASYAGHMEETEYARNRLDLDEPKHINGAIDDILRL